MRQWVIWLTAVALLFAISGCSSEVEGMPIDTEFVHPTIEETEPPVILLDSLEYWDIVQDEILDMLQNHNLYIDIVSHAYPCVQFYVEPGIVTEDGKVVASGLTQEEYKEVFELVKSDLHMILDKYKISKPKTIFHGCNSVVEIFFDNWFIDENKVYDRVNSRRMASYGLDLLEYYYEYEENSYIVREGFSTEVWVKYPVYKP